MPSPVPHDEGKGPHTRSQRADYSAHIKSVTEFVGCGKLFSLITNSRYKDIVGKIQVLWASSIHHLITEV